MNFFNTNSTAGSSIVNGTLSDQWFGSWIGESVSAVKTKVSDAATVVLTAITDTASSASETVTSTFNDYTANGTVIGDTATFVADTASDNSYFIRASGAVIGASAAVSSAVNILQGRQNINTQREFAKIALGTAMVAVSLYASNEDEVQGLGNVTLGAGLVTSLVKVATHVKETFHIHMYKLKSKEA